jgi:hypothetical protein
MPSEIRQGKRSLGELAIDFIDRKLAQMLSVSGNVYLHWAFLVTETLRDIKRYFVFRRATLIGPGAAKLFPQKHFFCLR